MGNNATFPGQKIYKIVDWFIPIPVLSAKYNEEIQRRYRLLVAMSLLKSVLWAGMVLVILIFTRVYSAYEISFLMFFLSMSLIGLLLPVNLRRTDAYEFTVLIDWIITRLAILVMIFVTGGIASPNIIWLMMGPTVTMIFWGTKAGFIDMFMVIGCFIGFRILGSNYVTFIPEEISLRIINIDAILATTFLTSLVLFFESSRQRTQNQLETVLNDLQVTNNKLTIANENALAASKAKSEFLANMSHEIRTPLNTVIGMTSMLLEMPQPGEQREFTEMVHRSGDALLSLINDILDLSKIEAGKLELEVELFDLYHCVEHAFDMLAASAEGKGLALHMYLQKDVPRFVQGDVTRLRQILINLLNNAVKFTYEGDILVSVKHVSAMDEIHKLQFSFKDSGIGIPLEGVNRLFQPFSQMDSSTTRKYGGTGLGLAISKQLVNLMGGTIWVESEEGVGSDFQFTIQLEALDSDLPAPDNQLKGKRLLLVDDNETSRFVLAQQAKEYGMVVETAVSTQEAIATIEHEEKFDIAIIDSRMPEMCGLALAEQIKKTNAGKTLPLVLMTTLNWQRNDPRQQYIAAYLQKPVKPSQLQSVLVQNTQDITVRCTEEDDSSAAEQLLGQSHPLKVLLAEDNTSNQKVALTMLAQLGYHADVAANGLDVLQAVQHQTYDVVLMDIHMPEVDGIEATREIRKTRGERPYIIAVTAYALQENKEECLQAGMNDFLSKPIRFPELIEALKQCPTPRDHKVASSNT